MNEFMLLIRNEIDHQAGWSSNTQTQFLKACELYIGKLKNAGKLIAAQPLVRKGTIVSGRAGAWKEVPFNETREVQVGYYHIRAADLAEAVAIAKENPEFAYGSTARIEVRPIKTEELDTRFVYPK